MGTAHQPVDADVECRLDGPQLVLGALRNDLEEDLAAVGPHRCGELPQLGRWQPDVLEADVAQPRVAERVVDLMCVRNGLVVARQHEDELDHDTSFSRSAGRISATPSKT